MSGGRIVRDSAASTLGVLLQGGARFVVSVMVGRIAGPAALALLNGSLSLATVASLLWPTSAGQAASIILAREEAAGRGHLVPAVQRHLTRRAAIVVGAALPVVAVVAALSLRAGWVTAAWVAALTVAFSAYNVTRGMQFGRGRVLQAAFWEGVSALTTLGLLAAVLIADLPGLYLLPLTLGYAVYAVGGWPRGATAGPSLPEPLRKELDQYVVWGVLGTFASTGLLHLSMVIAVATESADDAGMYAAAISLATPAAMLATAFSMALAPTMARSVGRADPGALGAQTDAATRALVAGMVLVFGVISILAPALLDLLYGAAFADAVVVLRILLVAVLFSTLPVAATNSITARGSDGVRLSAVMAVVALALGLGAIAVLAPLHGVLGVAVGYLVGATVKAVLPLGYVWRHDQQSWSGLTLRTLGGVLGPPSVAFLGDTEPLTGVFLALLFALSWTLVSSRDLRKHLRGRPQT